MERKLVCNGRKEAAAAAAREIEIDVQRDGSRPPSRMKEGFLP